jgi:hypothetical protein
MARLLKRLLLLAILGASVAAAVRALRGRSQAASPSEDSDAGPSWPVMSPITEPATEPSAAAPAKAVAEKTAPASPAKKKDKAPAKKAAAKGDGAGTDKKAAAAGKSAASWSAPVKGSCPDGYPVKANSSGIYHVPGGQSYDRTVPERCYPDPKAAEADGYRAARR